MWPQFNIIFGDLQYAPVFRNINHLHSLSSWFIVSSRVFACFKASPNLGFLIATLRILGEYDTTRQSSFDAFAIICVAFVNLISFLQWNFSVRPCWPSRGTIAKQLEMQDLSTLQTHLHSKTSNQMKQPSWTTCLKQATSSYLLPHDCAIPSCNALIVVLTHLPKLENPIIGIY